MSKREKIILGLMLAGLLYAGWAFFLDPAGETGREAPLVDKGKLDGIINEVNSIVKQGSLNKIEEYEMEMAAKDWSRDPFHKSPKGKSGLLGKKGEDKEDKVVFTYDGFIEFKGSLMAVINGVEYRKGDELEAGGYYLADIFRQKAQIVKKDAEGDVVDTINVFLVEDTVVYPADGEAKQ